MRHLYIWFFSKSHPYYHYVKFYPMPCIMKSCQYQNEEVTRKSPKVKILSWTFFVSNIPVIYAWSVVFDFQEFLGSLFKLFNDLQKSFIFIFVFFFLLLFYMISQFSDVQHSIRRDPFIKFWISNSSSNSVYLHIVAILFFKERPF